MSEVRANTISAANGTDPVTLTKQIAPKCYANTNAAGTSLNESFGISSLVDVAPGKQGFNFTSAMSSANYSGAATNGDSSNPDGLFFVTNSSSRVDGHSLQFDNADFADNPQRIIVIGDLA